MMNNLAASTCHSRFPTTPTGEDSSENTTHLVQRSVQLSNMGSRLFENGSFGSARGCFQQAISFLNESLAIQRSTVPEEEDSSSSVAHGDPQNNETFEDSPTILMWSTKAPIRCTPSLFVFSRVIHISLHDQRLHDRSRSNNIARLEALSVSCAVAMLYNLALSLQHVILQDGPSPQYQFERVAKIYHAAQMLFPMAPTDVQYHLGSIIPIHLKIAIYCNLGHALHELADDTTAAECFNCMLIEMIKLNLAGGFEVWFPSAEDSCGLFANSVFKNHAAMAA